MKDRIVYALIGAVIGFFAGSGTGLVVGPGIGFAGGIIFAVVGAVVGFFATRDIRDLLRKLRRR